MPCWPMSWHRKRKISLKPSPARPCPALSRTRYHRGINMKYVVHVLREYTCSKHKVTTHELKETNQGVMQYSEFRVRIHKRNLEETRKQRGQGGECVAGHSGRRGVWALGTRRVSCRCKVVFGCLADIEGVYWAQEIIVGWLWSGQIIEVWFVSSGYYSQFIS